MSPPLRAAGASEAAMTINSTSSPLAAKIPQSFAAKRGNAVMVKPAFDILILGRRSWLAAKVVSNPISPRTITTCASVHQQKPHLDSGPASSSGQAFRRNDGHPTSPRFISQSPNLSVSLCVLWNLVSHLLGDFGCQPVIGDVVKSHFAIDEAALGLDRLDEDFHARVAWNSRWAQGREKFIVGQRGRLFIHF